jgi:type II secretory pathway pseudopilin PulG
MGPVIKKMSRRAAAKSRAFSLVELLAVIGVIGLLMVLIVPAIQGLVAPSGNKAAVNQLVNALEQIRMAAIENGVNAYLAMPPETAPEDVKGSAFMLLRDTKDGEAGPYVPLSRWQRMPTGVLFNKTSILDTTSDWTGLPNLQSQSGPISSGDLQLIRFDRFGRVPDLSPFTVNIQVGQGQMQADGTVNWRNNRYDTIQIQRLTGRVLIDLQ